MRSATAAGCVAAAAVAAVSTAAWPQDPPHDERGTLRVAVASRIGEPGTLSPLVYWGGFETKTAVFEPLVGVALDGAPGPALAESWQVSDDGCTWSFTLRSRIVCHDGATLDAEGVRDHLVRWRGNPAHRWLAATELMERIDAPDARTVTITLARPWYLLPELAVVNPAHVVAPGAWNQRGEMTASVGTGPFRLVAQTPLERLVLEPHDAWWGPRTGVSRLELVALPTRERESEEVLRTLLRGDVDLVADGETPRIVRDQLAEIEDDPRWRVWSSPGSNVHYLNFQLGRAPFSDVSARRRVAAAVDRDELVRGAELGYAAPWTSMFRAPGAGWPYDGAAPPASPPDAPALTAVLLLPAAPPARLRRHAALLAGQCARAGIRLIPETAGSAAEFAQRRASGDFDLAFGATQGIPYDPWISARSMFLRDPASMGRQAQTSAPLWSDAALDAALRDAFAARDDAGRSAAFARAQARLDEEVPLLPLFVPRRIAVSRADVAGVHIAENGYDFGLATVRRTAR